MIYPRFIRVICWSSLMILAVSQASQADDLLQGDLGLPDQGQSNNLVPPPVAEDEPPAPRLSPADAANLVHQRTGGQVMSVSTRQAKSGTVYGVKILNSGRMRVVHVDGNTGDMLNP